MEYQTALVKSLAEGWAVTGKSAADTAGKAAKAAAAGRAHYLTGFTVAVSAAAAAATAAGFAITIKDGTTVIWETLFPASAAVGTERTITFTSPLKCSVNSELSVNVAALGANSIAIMNITGYTL